MGRPSIVAKGRSWSEAGHDVDFATETGESAVCDQVTLTGQGLPFFARSLRAHADNVALYKAMTMTDAYRAPVSWTGVKTADFDVLHFPGWAGGS